MTRVRNPVPTEADLLGVMPVARPGDMSSNESGMFDRSASAEILERARSNLLDAVLRGSKAPLPRPGWRWETYALLSREKAMEFCTPMEAIHFAQSPVHHGGFESRLSSARIPDLAGVEERNLAKEFPQFADLLSSFTESPLSAPPTVAAFRERLVSSPLYSHVRFILRCLCYCRPGRICEIGGGYGAPARLWMTNAAHRPRQYWIVDLPESLFFADVYLMVHFGIGDVLYIVSPADVERAVGNCTQGAPRFVLCSVHNLPHMAQERFDLVTNTLSMQEMSEEYVDFYMRWLDKQPCRFFYSFNYAVQALERMEESMNVAAPRLSRRWVTRFIQHTGETPYAFGEILAEKCGGDSEIPYEEIAGRWRRYVDGRLRPGAFFDLLDCARFSDDVREVWSLVKRAVNELEYVPKEVVHLLRRLQQMDAAVLPAEDRIVLTGLQQVFGKRVVGVEAGSVSPHLEGIRDKLVLADPVLAKEAGSRLRGGWSGTLEAEGASENLVINEKAVKVSDGFYGAIERLGFEGEALVVSGWAGDTQSRKPVSKVVCFAGGSLVAVTEPSIERPDIAGGFGAGLSRPGFRLRLPRSVVGPIDSSTVRCFALVAEGIAGELRQHHEQRVVTTFEPRR